MLLSAGLVVKTKSPSRMTPKMRRNYLSLSFRNNTSSFNYPINSTKSEIDIRNMDADFAFLIAVIL